jgi:hypothetical protein
MLAVIVMMFSIGFTKFRSPLLNIMYRDGFFYFLVLVGERAMWFLLFSLELTGACQNRIKP